MEVKTATHFRNKRCEVFVCTRDGSQSWNGLPEKLDPGSCDYLFVLVADGRRWFIPSSHFGRDHGIVLGGPKYDEFEIEPGDPTARVRAEPLSRPPRPF